MEDERFKVFLEGLLRYREWEEERMNTNPSYQQQPTAPEALAKNKDHHYLLGPEYLHFKNLKDPSILMKDGPLPLPSF